MKKVTSVKQTIRNMFGKKNYFNTCFAAQWSNFIQQNMDTGTVIVIKRKKKHRVTRKRQFLWRLQHKQHCLPILNEAPRSSSNKFDKSDASKPIPAVKLSPIAPMTSISPGLSLWTLVGTFSLLVPSVRQGKGVLGSMKGCSR